MTAALLACGAGFAAGILSAFGIGGGSLLLLVMTLFLGIGPAEARSINLLYFLPTALTSLYCHRKNGYLHREVIRRAVPFGLLCAVGGVVTASFFSMALLQKLFGFYLLWAGLSVLVRHGSVKKS